MKNLNPTALLRGNPYPGRDIVLDSSPNGEKSVIICFIMERSENPRNRVFVETPDGIHAQASDPSKMADPSLIIYTPVRVFGTSTIVTNGDQTDTIREGLVTGKTFARTLRTRASEPDAPNYTSRISGLVRKSGDCTFSILKNADGDPASCRRYFFVYEALRTGQDYFIRAYMGDGTPLPSFAKEPEQVEIPCDTPAKFTDLLWDSLDAENGAPLFVRYIGWKTGGWETMVKNKHASA